MAQDWCGEHGEHSRMAADSDTLLFIDGAWSDGGGRATLPVINPATGETIGSVARAEHADLDRALAAAERGLRDLAQGLAPTIAAKSCARPAICCASAPTRSRRS